MDHLLYDARHNIGASEDFFYVKKQTFNSFHSQNANITSLCYPLFKNPFNLFQTLYSRIHGINDLEMKTNLTRLGYFTYSSSATDSFFFLFQIKVVTA